MIQDFEMLTWQEIAEIDRCTAFPLLPIGSVEQHGPHLPVGTDDIILMNVLERAKTLIKEGPERGSHRLLVMPPILYGNSHEHLAFPGSISLSCHTLVSVIEDILECLSRYAFRRLIIFNSHGGNTALVHAYSQEWEARFGIQVFLLSLWSASFSLPEDGELFSSPPTSDYHAGERETSLIQYYEPDAVREENITEALSNEVTFRSYYSGWQTGDISPGNGTLGQPILAHAGKGKQCAELLAKKLVSLIDEIMS